MTLCDVCSAEGYPYDEEACKDCEHNPNREEYKMNEIKDKDISDMTLEEFRNIQEFGQNELFNNIIIVPTEDIHDSGYRCMKFILVYGRKIVGCVYGGSDVIHPNGIGNVGENFNIDEPIPYMGLSMDCLPVSGCIRIMTRKMCKCADFVCSDFIFYTI